jgi:hypothetical protein
MATPASPRHSRPVASMVVALTLAIVVGGVLVAAGASSNGPSKAGDVAISSNGPIAADASETPGPADAPGGALPSSPAPAGPTVSEVTTTSPAVSSVAQTTVTTTPTTTPTTTATTGPSAPQIIIVCESTTVSKDGIETSSSYAYRAPAGTPIPSGCRTG